jgi:hypothetical protein
MKYSVIHSKFVSAYLLFKKPCPLIILRKALKIINIIFSIFRLIGGHPNTYTFTKNLAEAIILKEAANIPTAIVRPSIGKLNTTSNMRAYLFCYAHNSSDCCSEGAACWLGGQRIRNHWNCDGSQPGHHQICILRQKNDRGYCPSGPGGQYPACGGN